MGASLTSPLTNLYVGKESPDTKEDRLKKAKIGNVLTTKEIPKKPVLKWKSLKLDEANHDETIKNIIEGVEFIHKCRCDTKSVLVMLDPEDCDTIVFATCYLMTLSGLSPLQSTEAMEFAMREKNEGIIFQRKYMPLLQTLYDESSALNRREKLFNSSGKLSISLLTDDVGKVYQLAQLPKPSVEQVKLIHPQMTKEDAQQDQPNKAEETTSTVNIIENITVDNTIIVKDEPPMHVSEESDLEKHSHLAVAKDEKHIQEHNQVPIESNYKTDKSSGQKDEKEKGNEPLETDEDELSTMKESTNDSKAPTVMGTHTNGHSKERSKVAIRYAPIPEYKISVDEVDEYLKNSSEEERIKNRIPVKIVRMNSSS